MGPIIERSCLLGTKSMSVFAEMFYLSANFRVYSNKESRQVIIYAPAS